MLLIYKILFLQRDLPSGHSFWIHKYVSPYAIFVISRQFLQTFEQSYYQLQQQANIFFKSTIYNTLIHRSYKNKTHIILKILIPCLA